MMTTLDIHAPATHQPYCYERAELARKTRLKTERQINGRKLSRHGYVTYLPHPERHTNGAPSYPGFGATPEEAYVSACYWANQAPWIRTVPFFKAPKWAQAQSRIQAIRRRKSPGESILA